MAVTDNSAEAREVLDSLYSYTEGYPYEQLSKDAIAWLYGVAYDEFRKKAHTEAVRQIEEEKNVARK